MLSRPATCLPGGRMTELRDALTQIKDRLKLDLFKNEQSISQGIVLPVLQNLGWDIFRSDIVWPEYTSGKGRVDYALCCPPGKPRCFIEVKQAGTVEGGGFNKAIEQLMSYAFHSGAQFAVLTDGQTWSFYLPAEPGSYEERRVFMLDLFEHEANKAAEVLSRYLLEDAVKSGEAMVQAKSDLHNAARRDKAKREIPSAWKDLVQEQDSALIERLANECESKIGIRPENSDVAAFLKQLSFAPVVQTSNKKQRQYPEVKAKDKKKQKQDSELVYGTSPRTGNQARDKKEQPQGKSREISYRLYGQEHVCSTMTEAFIEIFTELARKDPSFLSRCASDTAFSGRTRKRIGRSKVEMLPNRPELRNQVKPLPGGWLIFTHSSTEVKINLLEHACRIAGIEFGQDLQITLPN